MVNQARAMAHYLHRSLREAYLTEKAEPDKPADKSNLRGLMAAMGI